MILSEDKGSGGLEELFDGFNSSQILYAFCGIKDPNTDLIKYVLINWVLIVIHLLYIIVSHVLTIACIQSKEKELLFNAKVSVLTISVM